MNTDDEISDAEIDGWRDASFKWQSPASMIALAETMQSRGRERVMFATKLSFFRDVWLSGQTAARMNAISVRRLPPEAGDDAAAPDCAMKFREGIKRYELVEAMKDEKRGARYQGRFDGKEEGAVRDMPLLSAEVVTAQLERVVMKKS